MNTFSDIYLHIVFSVKYRDAVIDKFWKQELHAYIAEIFKSYGHHPIIVGGITDHVHALIGNNLNQTVPDMMKEVKQGSSRWINVGRKTRCKFAWQKGYGVFSYSKNQIETVRHYIANQEHHHKKVNMVAEFQSLLNTRAIAYDTKYLPHMPE